MPLGRTYGSMNFEKRKAMKQIVEDLEQDDLIEPTHSDRHYLHYLYQKRMDSIAWL